MVKERRRSKLLRKAADAAWAAGKKDRATNLHEAARAEEARRAAHK